MLNLMGMKTKGNYHSRLDPGIRKDISGTMDKI